MKPTIVVEEEERGEGKEGNGRQRRRRIHWRRKEKFIHRRKK